MESVRQACRLEIQGEVRVAFCSPYSAGRARQAGDPGRAPGLQS